MKNTIWEDKKKWDSYKGTEYYSILGCSSIPDNIKERISSYKEGLYETPKTYVDGFAYNDGSWLIYNTCRITNGKFRNKVMCRTKNDVISYLYDYLCFLRKVGIIEKYELRYYSLCYIVNKLALPDGVFSKTEVNKNKIMDLVLSVLKKDIDDIFCFRYDDRKFCMDPKMKKGKSIAEKTAIQRKNDKKMNYDKIMELYDENKTYDQNVFNMKRQGVDICNKTLRNVLKDRKVK